MHRTLLLLGAIGAAALTIWGIALTVDAVSTFSGTRIGDTRTAVPGARDMELDEGRHTVFYEIDEDFVLRSGDDTEVPVPPLEVTIRRRGDGRALDLDDYGGSFDVTSGGRAATAVRTVNVPRGGVYRLRASGRAGGASPAVVLGKPVTRRALRLVVALAAVVAGLAALALMVALWIASRRRRRPSV